jgi:DNA replication licensing factor MCM5
MTDLAFFLFSSTMTDWDRGSVFSSPQGLNNVSGGDKPDEAVLTNDGAVRSTRDFIRNYSRDRVFIYRDMLLQNYRNKQYHVEIDLDDLKNGNIALHDAFTTNPSELLPMMQQGAQEALASIIGGGEAPPSVQVLFCGDIAPTLIREVSAVDMNRLVLVPGIVINAARTRPRASVVVIRCKNCGDERNLPIPAGFGAASLPRVCYARCGLAPAAPDRSLFIVSRPFS